MTDHSALLASLVLGVLGVLISAFSLDGASAIVRLWVWLYTLGLPTALRDRRRAELASDVHEQIADARAQGYRPGETAARVLWRSLRGLHADVLWRLDHSLFGWSRYGTLARTELGIRWRVATVLRPSMRVAQIQVEHADKVLADARFHLRRIPKNGTADDLREREAARIAVKRAARTAKLAHLRLRLSVGLICCFDELLDEIFSIRSSGNPWRKTPTRVARAEARMRHAVSQAPLLAGPWCTCQVRGSLFGRTLARLVHGLWTARHYLRSE